MIWFHLRSPLLFRHFSTKETPPGCRIIALPGDFREKGGGPLESNKKLAVELTIAFIQAWFGKEKTLPMSAEECVGALSLFKEALDAMSDTKQA